MVEGNSAFAGQDHTDFEFEVAGGHGVADQKTALDAQYHIDLGSGTAEDCVVGEHMMAPVVPRYTPQTERQ